MAQTTSSKKRIRSNETEVEHGGPIPINSKPILGCGNNSVVTPDTEIDVSTRKVRFNCKVKVVLIPCLAEYRKENIHTLLWWNSQDYQSSYQDMILNDRNCIATAETLL
mmetsp:Transcript_32196/g.44158  ORF Transcript_32196/g.44158 Transcript_32196/m.44158 type:complete len:109 (+) Transcript_32196:186-512(+)